MNAAHYAGWGNICPPPPRQWLVRDWRFESLPDDAPLLAVGMRRSYGDLCANDDGICLSTRFLDRLLGFDPQSGRLDCETGITLGEILRVVLPRGWYLPVVPGTRFVTLGGAIASDVHGKNHARAGSFGCHVRELELLRSDRDRVICSEAVDGELFRATIGGLGLTGLITRAVLQLRRVPGGLMDVEEIAFGSLAEFVERTRDREAHEYSVAWVDSSRLRNGCSGVLSLAEHAAGDASAGRDGVAVPATPPFPLLGNVSAWCLARAYAALKRGARRRLQDHAAYFFPLDGLRDWNRLYGRRGFHQYQCVIPQATAEQGVAEILAAVHRSALVSPLIVLKDFGAVASPGLLSFPRPGLTLAMDFPNAGARVHELFARLDSIVREHGGALYAAKDARMAPALFAASYPQLPRFIAQLDPCFSSTFWRRVRCTNAAH